MTGACHAPVDGRQGKALADTDPTASSVPIEKSADLEMDCREDFSKSSLPVGGSIEANSIAERMSVTAAFDDLGTTPKPKKDGKASAEAAYPLGERNALLMATLSKVPLRYFWQK